MGAAGDEICDSNWRGVDACRDQPGDVSDIREMVCVSIVCDRLNSFPFDLSRVCRVARDDHIGIELACLFGKPLVIDIARLGVDLVLLDLEQLAREVRRMPMGEVAAMSEVK